MKIKLLMCGLAIAMCSNAMAQEGWATEDTSQRTRPQMFELSPNHYNHTVNISLPNDGLLHIDFLRLSDWGEENRIGTMANIASMHVAALKDSFKSTYSGKLVAINVPIDEELISVKYEEDMSKQNQMVWKNGEYYQLKTQFDTVRIIKNIGVRKKPLSDSGLIQAKYTFILKDLSDIQDIAANEVLLKRIGNEVDSVIDSYRKKWDRQDQRTHHLSIDIDDKRKDALSIHSSRNIRSFIREHIGVSVAFGGIVFRNNIAPYVDLSLAYLFPSNSQTRQFIAINTSSFDWFRNDFYNRSYNITSLEFGICKKTSSLMQKKTSVTFGVLTSDYKDKEKVMLNFGVNYGINSYFSVGLNSCVSIEEDDLKSNDRDEGGFIGVHFKFNL